MSALTDLLTTFRQAAVTEREKGTYFEELVVCYLRNEPYYQDLYSQVWTYKDWAASRGLDGKDRGIDLVAQTAGTGEFHAIQCKFYADNYRVTKGDIDSFFTASGKTHFTQRVIVTTTNNWNDAANEALENQQPPCTKIDLTALEQSQIDWSAYRPHTPITLKAKKDLRPHQLRARKAVLDGLAQAERGKLIMACGTGKTFTSLKIAEAQAGAGKRVLFLVPSLALLSQSLTEWTQESDTPLHSFAVCSDHEVGKKRKKTDDSVQTFAHELRYPATTDAKKLVQAVAVKHDPDHMTVVFSTYHSIEVIREAQQHGLLPFDLIICDEAHRTTGATFEDEEESAFVRIHDNAYVQGARRLYMTATPRIYGEAAQAMAEKSSVTLCSMDDETLYGKELFVITFNDAVRAGLLVDYKVVVLAMDEAHVQRRMQKLLSDGDNSVKVEDAAKIIGCWKALSKQDMHNDLADDKDPMRRAVAFCQVIEYQAGNKIHKISSKKIKDMFAAVVEAYKESAPEDEPAAILRCEAEHVDGGMTASEKDAKLSWLKSEIPENSCRILSNVRCLSEGVDVPSLDAVLFLSPRNSQVDVVQSVGRVMRRDPAGRKQRGYVILPVVIPAGMEPDQALNDNKTYKVVWQVLQALRSHDDRFDAMINKMELVGPDTSRMEIIAVSDKIARKTKKEPGKTGKGGTGIIGKGNGKKGKPADADKQHVMEFEIGDIERALYAKVVQKCGNRLHWEEWAEDIAKIARTHITRISTILENPANTMERSAFDAFAAELRDDLNHTITDDEIIEMLAQHLITKPVFDALFANYSFASHNPMSLAMQDVLNALQEHHLDKEADTLQKFYDSVKVRAEGIDSAAGKQKIMVELYDKFFSKAFPRLRDKLGIVYTPVEVVDFIIHSVNDVLQSEFGQTLGSDDVHIIDPFTGTGTFITRLLQSGLMSPDQISKKYKSEIHANEIVLLAYYIAAINIESVYHGLVGGDYVPFEGICLTDTFQMYEKEDLVDQLLEQNSARRKRQKALDIRVIIGNPPYSAGQDSANDNNQNVSYERLDARIRDTYAAHSSATLKNSLYDSYLRAIRWASDRIGISGVIGFVTNAGFLESNSADGVRKCLADEFSSIYVFHLRGNARTSGEQRRKEKDNVFGVGSRAPVAISLLVKNPAAKEHGQIYFHDIGDYLSRDEKLGKIQRLGSIQGISGLNEWQNITPDTHGDWLKQRDDSFSRFLAISRKTNEGAKVKLFENYSSGVKTNRDAWVYNHSRTALISNVTGMIDFYNEEVGRYQIACKGLSKTEWPDVDGFLKFDSTKISWTREIKQDLFHHAKRSFVPSGVRKSLYRPFTKSWMYFNKHFNNCVYQMPSIFPTADAVNLVIQLTGAGATKGFSCLISDTLPDLEVISKGQCFPLYLYDEQTYPTGESEVLFGTANQGAAPLKRRDSITDAGLQHFHDAYPGSAINKADVFYYVYGLLHSPDYRERYADNLSKELPRIPCVKGAPDFWAFSKAGRALADLHLNYESAPLYPAKVSGGSQPEDYRVEKMRYGKDKDKSTLIYNSKITVTGIPLEAYEYVVNGKPALDWVVERQCVKIDKDSGIENDANDWAIETMNNPKYPLELFLRMITVSLETMKIVKSLPPLDVLDSGESTMSEVFTSQAAETTEAEA